jgi:hypothetical protein
MVEHVFFRVFTTLRTPMSHSHATKTLRQPLEHRPGVCPWFTTTRSLFNQVAAFYWQVLDAHPAVLGLPGKESLTTLERLTHTTADNPHPVMPLSGVAAQVPALLRRAAINAALGSMHSFQTHLAKWKRVKAKAELKGKPCRVRPPIPPANLEPLGDLLRGDVEAGDPWTHHSQALRWADLALGALSRARTSRSSRVGPR